MSIPRLNTDITFFKLFASTQENNDEILIQHAPWVVRKACLHDVGILADLLTLSFHPSTGWMQYFIPVLRLGIYEDLRHRIQSQSHPLPYACLVATYDPDSESTSTSPQESADPPNLLASHGYSPHNDQVEMVGTVEVSVKQRHLALSKSTYVYLANLAVRAEYRRQGVASHLLQGCEILARRWGFRDIYLHVLENNTGARALYQKLGYEVKKSEADLVSWLFGRPRQLLLHKRLFDEVGHSN